MHINGHTLENTDKVGVIDKLCHEQPFRELLKICHISLQANLKSSWRGKSIVFKNIIATRCRMRPFPKLKKILLFFLL